MAKQQHGLASSFPTVTANPQPSLLLHTLPVFYAHERLHKETKSNQACNAGMHFLAPVQGSQTACPCT
eukprot:957026-Amphidinium_carterae.1